MVYQAESGPWRNFYLTGAQELRNGVVKDPTPNTASPDTVRAMTAEMYFDYLAVHINGQNAGDEKSLFNINLGSDGGKYKLELENSVLNHTAIFPARGNCYRTQEFYKINVRYWHTEDI